MTALQEDLLTLVQVPVKHEYFSGGTGVGISNGVVSIGQEVATTSNVTFNNITVDGNLTINGDTTTIDTTSLVVEDLLLNYQKKIHLIC